MTIRRGVCVRCSRFSPIVCEGMCCACNLEREVTCRDCGRFVRRAAKDRCARCQADVRRGVSASSYEYFGPRVRTPIQPMPMRLGVVERKALRDVALTWAGRKLS